MSHSHIKMFQIGQCTSPFPRWNSSSAAGSRYSMMGAGRVMYAKCLRLEHVCSVLLSWDMDQLLPVLIPIPE